MPYKTARLVHPWQPVAAADSRVLLLGTIPSPQSRENGFYYGNPRNRFWKVLAAVYQQPEPNTIAEKKAFLLRNYLALWDVLHACRIDKASDDSIREPVANPIAPVLQKTQIHAVYTTGKKAYTLYEKLVYPQTGLHAVYLPSTSPANCRISFSQLVEAYGCLPAVTAKS